MKKIALKVRQKSTMGASPSKNEKVFIIYKFLFAVINKNTNLVCLFHSSASVMVVAVIMRAQTHFF